MKKSMAVLTLLLLGFGALVLAGGEGEKAESPKTAILWPAGDLKWTDIVTARGAKMAVLWGDPKTGAYGSLKMLPAGSVMGLHTHTHDQRVVLVSGTVILSIEGSAPKELGPGSYAFIPGGVEHVADCKPGADCVYFEEQPGPSDVHAVTGVGK